ncbi:MAG TPA: ATP-binding protein [Candidatus Methylacidiphilales bacterium]|nr:ATP-binding protein [Candidatus Methylacidiphilales bacterium]
MASPIARKRANASSPPSTPPPGSSPEDVRTTASASTPPQHVSASPASPPPLQPQSSQIIQHHAQTPSDGKANILLVDDREDKRLAMETVIAELGQNIIQANSGREALRHLLNQTFAVILLDVNMPGMDGFETALLIRQRKSLENIPIIFVSAISDTETHVSRGYSLGAVDYILAPIVPEILRAKVAVFVELFKIADQVKRQAEDLRLAHSQLEKRVEERTQELARVNKSLQKEVKERQKAEENLRILNSKLEERVADRTAELRAANKELETFSYSIAHDLRAPFRQIHGYAEILEEDFADKLPAEARTYLSRIGAKSKEMEAMVDDLLRLFVVAKEPFDVAETNLRSLAQEVMANLRSEGSNAARSIQFTLTENLPATIRGNAGLMRQVLENLLSNAVKYTRPRKTAEIELGCEDGEAQDKQTTFYVRDNGVGFAMEQADRLFGVFQRLHRMEEFEGTGIGLALVSRIIAKHGGRVWARGEVGGGATFYFTLGKSGHDPE